MTDSARIKIACSDNIFFAINSRDFVIDSTDAPPVKPVYSSQNNIVTDEDVAITLTAAMLVFDDNTSIESLEVLAGENYSFDGLTVTPALNINGNITVNMTATANGLMSDVFQVNISVNAINDEPVAIADAASVEQDSVANEINVLMNDVDVDDASLTIISTTINGSGSADISGNNIIYTPASGFNGTEIITYTVADSLRASATAELTITVIAAPVTIPPVPPTSTSESSSSGGSMFYLLAMLFLLLIIELRRGQRNV